MEGAKLASLGEGRGGGVSLMVFAGVTRVQSQESSYYGLMYSKLSE